MERDASDLPGQDSLRCLPSVAVMQIKKHFQSPREPRDDPKINKRTSSLSPNFYQS